MPDAPIQAGFVGLLEAHRALLYKVARIFGRTPAEREDLTQEIIVNLWRAYPRYDPHAKFSTWTYRIALNVAISWRRRERTQTQHLSPSGEVILDEVAISPAPQQRDEANLAFLYSSIERFDDFDKALVMLYLDGLNHAEISAVLGISSSNSATKIGRIKERLRQAFRLAGEI
jgi:RNA polymerase sigma factor (sigma-70 family)